MGVFKSPEPEASERPPRQKGGVWSLAVEMQSTCHSAQAPLQPTFPPSFTLSLLFLFILAKTNCLSHQPEPRAFQRFMHETNYAPLISKLAAFPLPFI